MNKEEKIDYVIRAKEKCFIKPRDLRKFTKKNGTTIPISFFLLNLNLYTCKKEIESSLNLF